MKFLNFSTLWVIFALLDPDPDSEYGSGSTGLIESGSGSKTLGIPIKKNINTTIYSRKLSCVADQGAVLVL